MGSLERSFQILGIAPTKEKRLVKKAYAEKVKGCHPEEEPEQWKQLHDAYKEALRYAEKDGYVQKPVYTKEKQKAYTLEQDQNKEEPLKSEKNQNKTEVRRQEQHQNNEEVQELKKKLEKEPKQKPEKEPKQKPEKESREQKPEKELEQKPEKESKEQEPEKEPKQKPEKESKEQEPEKEPKQKPEKEPKQKPEKESKQKPEKEPEKWEAEPQTDEIEQLLEEITLQSDRKRQERQQDYQKKLAMLESCEQNQALECWNALFQDEDFKWYCQEKQFWEMLMRVLQKANLNQKTNTYIENQIKSLEEYFLKGMQLDKASFARRAGAICREKKRYVSLFGGTVKVLKKHMLFTFFGILFVLVFVSGLYRSGKEKEMDIRGELSAYLDEKYGAGSYQVEDFIIDEIEISPIYRYEGAFRAYEAEWIRDPEKKVCIWFYKSSEMEEKTVLCLDSFQQQEIQEDLQQELVQAVEAEKGMVYMNSSEPQYVQVRFKRNAAVYHTRYEGNLGEFFQKEKEVRKKWIRQDEHSAYKILENPTDNINGRCVFWFPDPVVADMRESLENPQGSLDNSFCQKIKAIEESYEIQVMAASVPQSYYESMEQALQDDMYNEEVYLNRTGYIFETTLPLELPFVTNWYMSGQLHTISPKKLEEGIYLMDVKEDVKTEIMGSVKRQENKISITCSNEDSRKYVVILDQKQLRMEAGNYYIVDEQEETPMPYLEYPYTMLGERYNVVLIGEDFLYIPCEKSAVEASAHTISVFLEAYQKE